MACIRNVTLLKYTLVIVWFDFLSWDANWTSDVTLWAATDSNCSGFNNCKCARNSWVLVPMYLEKYGTPQQR